MQIQTTLVGNPFGTRSTPQFAALRAQTEKNSAAFRKLRDSVIDQVIATPNKTSGELAALVDMKHHKAQDILLTLTREGVLTRRKKIVDSRLCNIYVRVGVPLDSLDNTVSGRIYNYVQDHPGTLRAPIIDEVGRKSGASAICALVKSGRLRGEMIATGTHYYVVNAVVNG